MSTIPSGVVSDVDFGLDLTGTQRVLPGARFHEELARLRRDHALAPVRFNGNTALLITRFADLDAAFRDDEGLPAGPTYKAAIEPCQGVTFESLDGPEHHVLRALSTADLRSRPVARWSAEAIPPLAHSLVDRFIDAGEVDLVRSFTAQLPFLVFARKVGLPLDAADRFMDWAFGILSYPVAPEHGLASAAELTEHLRPVLADRRRAPADDLISAMCRAESDGRRLDDEEILSHVRALFAAGASTTFHGMGNTLYALLTHPEALDRLRTDRSLVLDAVDEMLRWEPPLGLLPRLVPHEAVVAGAKVAAGTQLLFGIASANRDPAVYEAPDRFDVDRRPQRLLTFGFGSHHCPGSHLARQQIAVAVGVLLDRLADVRLIDAVEAEPCGTVMRGPSQLRVSFRAR
jgi:cytochrome P450